MPWHIVEQGECISSISKTEGFFYDTLWNAPENAQLKQLRQNPNILSEGDKVFIPDLRVKNIPKPDGARYTFLRKGVPGRLRLQLLDGSHKPRAGLAYTLQIDTKEQKGTTDDQGYVDQPIPPDAETGVLLVTTKSGKTERHDLRLGHVNPHGDDSGTQQRLRNLGYSVPKEDGTMDDHTLAALKEFQADYNLPVTGQTDDATLTKLQQLHGS
jgi:hypothetical protein